MARINGEDEPAAKRREAAGHVQLLPELLANIHDRLELPELLSLNIP
jgi:hypothetical protein